MYDYSMAQNKGAWGNSATHVQSTATWRPRPQAIGARGALHLPPLHQMGKEDTARAGARLAPLVVMACVTGTS